MKELQRLLLENEAWATWHNENAPHYFSEMAKGQEPKFFWIGCSDSRVVPADIINSAPGDIFVYRNVANRAELTDKSFAAVCEYAIKFLKVNYIIVCGHYGCGGVKAAMNGIDNPIISDWVSPIKKLCNDNQVCDEKKLVELNVLEQVRIISQLQAVIDQRKERSFPLIAGWVYDIETGEIKDLERNTP